MECEHHSKCTRLATWRVTLTEKYEGPYRVRFSMLCCKVHAYRLTRLKNWHVKLERA